MDIDLMMSVVWWSSGATSPRHTLLSLLIEGALCWCLAAAATVGQGHAMITLVETYLRMVLSLNAPDVCQEEGSKRQKIMILLLLGDAVKYGQVPVFYGRCSIEASCTDLEWILTSPKSEM